MTWLAWRQFRTQTWIAAGGLVIVGALLLVTGVRLAHVWTDSGIPGCQTDCAGAVASFLMQARNGLYGTLYNASVDGMYVLPGVIGAFWGAPLMARELETGTYRLVWTQSVSRRRWLANKLLTGGLVSMATAGLFSLAVTWWGHHTDQAGAGRMEPIVFGARGLVPIGYAAFAFAVGVTAGMLIRRTVPAMGVTLAIYAGAAVSMPLWIRAHLIPGIHVLRPLDVDRINGLTVRMQRGGVDSSITVLGGAPSHGAWMVTNQTLDPSGQVFTGPANPQYCGPRGSAHECLRWLGTLNLRQDAFYQPASHFWPLQWAESGLFLAVALLLAGFCFWWTRRRLT